MDDNMGDDHIVIALDLNQASNVDPSPPSPQTPLTPDEQETSRVGIEDRIKQLQEVTARANQHQQYRRFKNKNQGDNGVLKGSVNSGGNSDGSEERVKNCKKDINHLAKALEDLDGKKTDNGNFFDCNICLVVAKYPIVTCCGHLFCSSCFDKVPYVDSFSKECPTCKGEVTDSNITPVYGSGKNSRWF